MKKLIGIAILSSMFGALVAYTMIEYGVINALKIWAMVVFFLLLILLAFKLIFD